MHHQIKAELVSLAAMDKLFAEPYNPPVLDEDAFAEEYLEAQNLIRCRIEKIGGVCDPISGNFVMNDSRGRSRWISIELHDETLIRGSFLPTIADALTHLSENYAVYVSHECPQDSIFHLIVFRDRVVHGKSKSKWLGQLLSGLR